MSSRQRNNVRKQRRILIYVLAIALVVLSWVRLTSKQTLVLHNQRYTTTYDTQTFLLKDEQVFCFDQEPTLLVQEGARISKQTVLFEGDTSTGAFYEDRNSLFNKTGSQPKGTDLIQEIESLAKEIQRLHSEEEKQVMADTLVRTAALLPYVSLSEEEWNTVKIQTQELVQDPYTGRTLLGLGGENPGYLYTALDGYETLLKPSNMEFLTDLSPEVLGQAAATIKANSHGIKVVDDNTAYVMAFVPQDLFSPTEEQAAERKKKIMESREEKDFSSYLDVLNRRGDFLRSMPLVHFFMEGEEYSGYLVDVLYPEEGEEKALILQLKEPMTGSFLSKRQLDLELVTYDDQGYVIPETSIVEKEDKTFIAVLNKGYLRKTLEITISHQEGDEAFLSLRDNPEITEGMQLLVNP